jgi:CheY-like chemotaxis protein
MEKKVHCIMLVDDNKDDNFFHRRVILKNEAAEIVVIKESGEAALEYLKTNQQDTPGNHPDIIFLDINMPRMNGWEFIQEYKKLDMEFQSKMVIVMLTTSDNPDDKSLARMNDVLIDIRTKPLTKEMLEEILDQFYCL